MTDLNSTISNSKVELSIVIIARNEALNIARTIESVLRAVKDIPNNEIWLVDSVSTDGTVEIAERYPINIARLQPTWFRSVGAGRFIGMHYTHGEFVLHVDGDMELDPDWIKRSTAFIKENPGVGAVAGYMLDIYVKNGMKFGEEYEYREENSVAKEVKHVGGAVLYRRKAIEAMGGCQPFIKGEESVSLSMGIRYAGYKVIRLPYLMSRHYTLPQQSVGYGLRRLRLNMWLGYGQVLRQYLGTDLFWIYLRERLIYTLVFLLGLLTAIATFFISVLIKNFLAFGFCLLIVAGFIGVLALRKHSIQKAFVSVFTQTGVAISALRGFFMRPRSPKEYPTDAEIIKTVSPFESI